MAGFAIAPFFNIKPKIPYLFTVDVYTSVGSLHNSCVQSVKYPVMEAAEGDGHIYLGNGIINIPTFNPASRTIEITFEETDSMSVSILFNHIMRLQYAGYAIKASIKITDFQDITNVRYFICKLQSFDNVQFGNTGSPNIGTITATFAVDAELPWEEGESVFTKIKGPNSHNYINNSTKQSLTIKRGKEDTNGAKEVLNSQVEVTVTKNG